MVTSIEAQEKIVKNTNDKIQNAADIKANVQARDENQKAWDAAREKLKKELEELDRPFMSRRDMYNYNLTELDKQTNELNRAGRLAEDELVYAKVVEEVGEMTTDAMKAFLHMCDIYTGSAEFSVTRPAKLKDRDIMLFKVQPAYSNYVLNFAVRGFDIVAVHMTEKARHPGDYSTYLGWIGTDLTETDLVRFGTEEQFRFSYRNNGNVASFREWLDILVETPSEKLVAIDLTKDKNNEAIIKFI